MFSKNLCDEVSKMENLRWTFSSFFRARRRGIWLFGRIQLHPVVNWPRKLPFFFIWNFLKISQYVLQKSSHKFSLWKKMEMTKTYVCSCRSSQYIIFFPGPLFYRRYLAYKLRQTRGPCVLREHFCRLWCHSQACKGLVCPPARFARWGAIISSIWPT